MADLSEEDARTRRRRALGADLVIPLLALAFAAYFFTTIVELDWEAKANGVVVGTVLVALAALQVGRTALAAARGGGLGLDPLVRPWRLQLRRIALVALLVLFIATIGVLGTTLGLMLMTAAAMRLLGVRDWRHLAGIPLAAGAVTYTLFIALLGARLPRGPVEQLLSLLSGG